MSTSPSSEDKNVTAAVCRSTPNGLNNLTSQIDKCTTTTEQVRNKTLGDNVLKLQQNIEQLRSTIGDSLIMGDSVFGDYGIADITKQVKDRNEELKNKKEEIHNTILKNEAIIERSSRDFSDVKDTLPEKQPKKVLNFIEDYTLAVLVIAYLFMVMSIIYLYTIQSTVKITGFLQALIGSVFLTCFMFIMLLYFS
jgi:hypothetical protein